jgi:hypothetical protein
MSATEEVGAPEPVQSAPASGTRWKRFGVMLGLTGAATAALVALTANGVLAANFSISGMPFKITATKLHGEGFEQFATIDNMVGADGSDPKSPQCTDENGCQELVMVSAINKAELTNLCQSVDLGPIAMKITAGDAGTPVTAKALVVDSDLIQTDANGSATFQNINVGQDSSTFDKVTDPATGKKITGGLGVFGQQADIVDITNLTQNNYATTASTFVLPHLHMSFTSSGC